jgi:hypothetical protein
MNLNHLSTSTSAPRNKSGSLLSMTAVQLSLDDELPAKEKKESARKQLFPFQFQTNFQTRDYVMILIASQYESTWSLSASVCIQSSSRHQNLPSRAATNRPPSLLVSEQCRRPMVQGVAPPLPLPRPIRYDE